MITNVADRDSKNEWARITREYKKAGTVLEHVQDRIQTAGAEAFDTNDTDGELIANAAYALLDQAFKRLNDAYTADRKRLGILVYAPYGDRRGRRR